MTMSWPGGHGNRINKKELRARMKQAQIDKAKQDREQAYEALKNSLGHNDTNPLGYTQFRMPTESIRIANQLEASEHQHFEICVLCKVRVYETKTKRDGTRDQSYSGLDICTKSQTGLHQFKEYPEYINEDELDTQQE